MATRGEGEYRDWLAEETRAHERQSRSVYGLVGADDQKFWRRRAAAA